MTKIPFYFVPNLFLSIIENWQIVLIEVRERIAAELFPRLQAFVAALDERKPFVCCQSNGCVVFVYNELLTVVRDLAPDLWQAFLESKGDEFKEQEKVILSVYWRFLPNVLRLNVLDVKTLIVAALCPGFEDEPLRSRFYDWFVQQGVSSKIYEGLREHSPQLSCWFLKGQGLSSEDVFEEFFYNLCIRVLSQQSGGRKPSIFGCTTNPSFHICMLLRADAHDDKLAAVAEKFHACIDRIAEIPREYWMWIHAVKLLGCLMQRKLLEKSSSVNLLAPDMFGEIALFVVPKSVWEPA